MTSVSSNSSRPRRARDASTTFVLVHGSGSSSLMWAPVQRELALLGHRSFAVDLPGHGFDAQYPVAYQAPQNLDA
jgi:pimeloyl-ACP methyl ester carboxylesterase